MNKKFEKRLLEKLKNNTVEECPVTCKEGIYCNHSSLGKICMELNTNPMGDLYLLYRECVPFSIVIILLENNLI